VSAWLSSAVCSSHFAEISIFIVPPPQVKNGPDFEEFTRQRNVGNEQFSFLNGGEGSEYYKWRVHVKRANLDASTAESAVTAHELRTTVRCAVS
jgi:Surp module